MVSGQKMVEPISIAIVSLLSVGVTSCRRTGPACFMRSASVRNEPLVEQPFPFPSRSVACVVVVGLGVVMGILIGVEVVVATRMGILELYPRLSPESLMSAPAPTERSEWRPGPGAALWVQNSELEWTEGCWRYHGGSGLKMVTSEDTGDFNNK